MASVNDVEKMIDAGEYALGLLEGEDLRRFEDTLKKDAALSRTVEDWEKKFAPLVETLAPVKPPRSVWESIEDRLWSPKRPGLWSSLRFWRPLALAASAAAILLAVITPYLSRPPLPPTPAYLSVLGGEKAEQVWLVRITPEVLQLVVKVLTAPTLPTDKSFELWMLPGADQAPVSLGLLPSSGTVTLSVAPEKMEMLVRAAGLAVSLEPFGGSPTGTPTGPVLYQGAILSL